MKNLAEDIETLLQAVYKEQTRRIPSVYDGLTVPQRAVLWYLVGQTMPVSESNLIDNLCSDSKILFSKQEIVDAIQFLSDSLRRYCLVDRVKDTYAINQLCSYIIDHFDEVNPVQNPICFNAPMALFLGFYSTFQCVPSYCLVDFCRHPFDFSAITPDLVGGFASFQNHCLRATAKWSFGEDRSVCVVLKPPGVLTRSVFLEMVRNCHGVVDVQSNEDKDLIRFSPEWGMSDQMLFDENVLTQKRVVGWTFMDESSVIYVNSCDIVYRRWFDFFLSKNPNSGEELLKARADTLLYVLSGKFKDGHLSSYVHC